MERIERIKAIVANEIKEKALHIIIRDLSGLPSRRSFDLGKIDYILVDDHEEARVNSITEGLIDLVTDALLPVLEHEAERIVKNKLIQML